MFIISFNKIAALFILITLLLNIHCATKGLVTERLPQDYYHIPKLLPENGVLPDTVFIVYSDNQAGWRFRDRFLSKDNWTNWRMLIFPFYQLYLVGNGVVGAFDFIRHKPDYGVKQRRLVRDMVYKAAIENHAAFILNAGDIVANDGRRPDHWKQFLDENKKDYPLLTEIPYLAARGNHEHTNDSQYGLPNFDAVFGLPGFYTVELTDAIIIITDSNIILDQCGGIDNDLQDSLFSQWYVSDNKTDSQSWLETQLANSTKRFKIVVMHQPPISFAKHHNDWYNPANGNDLIEKRQKLLGLFEEYNVDLVISGHDHIYQHNVLNRGNRKQIHFLIGGGAGGTLRSLLDAETMQNYKNQFAEEGLMVTSLVSKKIHHFFLMDVNPERLKIDVIEVNEDLENNTQKVDEIIIL